MISIPACPPSPGHVTSQALSRRAKRDLQRYGGAKQAGIPAAIQGYTTIKMGTLPIEAAQLKSGSQPRLGNPSTAVSRTENFHQLELIAVGGESCFFVDVFALDGGRGHGSGGGTRGRDKGQEIN
jgi:hypothetical protein